MLVDALMEAGVTVFCNTPVTGIAKGDVWTIATNAGSYQARFIILAAGGKTYPALGADGSGYTLAASLGHTIIPPVVSAVPVVSKNPLSHYVQGEKLVMQTTSVIEGKEQSTVTGDVMFTQYGLSGPAIFDISRDISIRINREGKQNAAVRLSFFPDTIPEEVEKILDRRYHRHATLPVSHALYGLFTGKAAGAVCAASEIPKDRIVKDLTQEEKERLVKTLTEYTAEVTDTRGWNEGEFTAGGVDTDEVDPKTLESKKAKGLYFAGEILNVDGQVGGFNLSWAWSTGFVAGKIRL